MNKIPDVPSSIFTLSAAAVGYLLTDDLTANEQNAVGNWLMLVSQVLCTNASYLQYKGGKKIKRQQKTTEETIAMMEKMIESLQKEVNDLKK